MFEPPSEKPLNERLNILGFKPTIYSPAYETITAEVIKECKDARIKVIPWTVNEVHVMNELKKMGVDGVISDYPDLFKQMN